MITASASAQVGRPAMGSMRSPTLPDEIHGGRRQLAKAISASWIRFDRNVVKIDNSRKWRET
jgi:hypothetical protein